MMACLGLDFGTTTSVLTVAAGGQLACFKLGGVSATPYIPSVLSRDKSDGSLEIGQAARLHQGDRDFEVYQYCKLLLAETDAARLQARGYSALSPREVATLYIQALIQRYQQESGEREINRLVITVPELWARTGQHGAREALKGICEGLGLGSVRLLSEPVAAGIYFSHCFKQRRNMAFKGHVLVCDYGGGTLDLSLSWVDGRAVQVLEGTGNGLVGMELGEAGVAYDEAVLRHLAARHKQSIENTRVFYKLLKDFEECKITHGDMLGKQLERYRRNNALNKKVFEVGDMPVLCEDLVTVFDEKIYPSLHNCLAEMAIYLAQRGVDIEDGEQFRVVMVGGFSSFYLVRHAIREFFHSHTEADPRFQHGFDLTDTALAISKGAALVAADAFEVAHITPLTLGIIAKNYFLEETDVILIERGVSVSIYQQPQFADLWLQVFSEEALDTTSLKLFLSVGGTQRRYLDLKGKLRELVPNPHKDNQWRIGCAVDADLVFTLYLEDKNQVVKKISLGNLLERVQGLHIA